jgi:eukaryotic-like serine/threonine-protein kinase
MGERADAERWHVVESLFEAALQRPPAERNAYLQEACANDPDLQREVASLLANAPADDPPPAWAAGAAVQLLTKPVVFEAGQRVGPYEIVSFLAAGGMGAVYRARDPRLGRDVAIKVSAEQFSDRFTREVRAVAALNHPNICTVHDVGPDYLVMELVEGETLAERLQRRGALPLDEALAIARQMAAGLEAAHEKRITHRDLKPGNIRITPDGAVKVLDFGLAKVTQPFVDDVGQASPAVTNSPTMLTSMAGAIVGTAAYMSPEQARGKPVDQRTDIWAFGVLLFEMLSGTRAYTGETLTDVVAAVITKAPDWSALPVSVPPRIRELLELCLERDPRERLQAVGDARILIERYLSRRPDANYQDGAPSQSVTGWRVLPWVVATALAITVAVLSVLYARHPAGEEPLTMLSLVPPEGGVFPAAMPPALSPDGRQIAIVVEKDGRRSVWIRELDESTARELPGTEVASVPFWKPDGQFIGFIAGGKLKRINRSGNAAALSLTDADPLSGGSWSKDDAILFGTGAGGLFRIASAGGTITQVTVLDRTQSEIRHGFPWFLPDGRHFLYTAISTDPSKSAIYIGELNSNAHTRVAFASSNGVYVKPGYLLYVREGTLLAQPFDADRLVTTGDAVPIAEDVDFAAGRGQPRFAFAVSEKGTLAYKSSRSQEKWQLTVYDRSGKALDAIGGPARVEHAVFSPDGRTAAFSREDPQKAFSADIWLHDMLRGGESRVTTTDGFKSTPVWSPDGRFIAFSSGRPQEGSDSFHMLRRGIDGTSREEVLTDMTVPSDWSRDGRYILGDRNGNRTGRDLWIVPLFDGRRPYPYLETPFNEMKAKMSPDGKWVAYVSDETSRNEIYVDSFPRRSGKRQISIQGGDRPVWSRNGNELFFIGADQTMMAADIRERGGRLDVSVPRSLFPVRVSMGFGSDRSGFDVSDDGRFLIPTVVNSGNSVPLTVVVNWPALIRK